MTQNPVQDPLSQAAQDRHQALKAEIAETIISRGTVTFAELSRIDGFNGEIAQIISKPTLNFEIMLWAGMSPEACDTLGELLEEKAIACAPCSSMLYLIDGVALPYDTLPASAASRRKPFAKTKTYWAPVCFSAFNRVKEDDRLPLRFSAPRRGEAA